MTVIGRGLLVLGVVLACWPARAAIIQVTTADNWTKIEAAKPGDIVEIAPGTYQFRVVLEQQGTAANPIIIRAKDPSNRPVWDLAGKPVSQWPGSYGAGDKGRACWQVKGSHYIISGIVFKNCQDEASAGLRAIDCGPLTIRDCVFASNTNGLTGSSEDYVVEFSEFYDNGKLVSTGNMTHNIYVYGGVFALRYSYVHDPHEGQNFHIRARSAVIEYNWIARPSSYPGDLMSCNTLCGGTGSNPITQKMLLRGNLLIQGTPQNLSQVIALYNDEPGGSYDGSGAVASMELTLVGNTFIGNQTSATQRLVNMRNDSGISTKVHLTNNIFVKLGTLFEAGDPAASNWSVDGQNNWVTTGTGGTNKLVSTIAGADPGFVNAAAKDYTLTATGPCIGKAASISGAPDKEYYKNETVKLQYRPRPTALDIGAFEHGNSNPPVGPYGTPPPPKTDGSSSRNDGQGSTSKDFAGASALDGNPLSGDGGAKLEAGGSGLRNDAGCSCRLGDSPLGDAGDLAGLVVVAAALALRLRRQRRRHHRA